MLIKSPCLKCTKRTIVCHHEGKCKDWKDYRAQIDAQNEAEKAEADWIGARVDSINKRRKRKNAKGYF